MPATRFEVHSSKRRSSTRSVTSSLLVSTQPSTKSKPSQKPVPGRVYTDAILAIKPEFTHLIVARDKNHEYRTYKLRETVVRLWLYTTAPKSAITHIMLTALPKAPGQVCDPTGVGNDDFDKGLTPYKFGYPVLGLYELKAPMELDVMKSYGISPPQGLVYTPKKLVDEFPLGEMTELF